MLSPTIRETLVAAGWIWPAYIQNRHVYALAHRLRAAEQEERDAILEEVLPSLYRPHDLAAMLLERYRKVPIVRDFEGAISEAIEAAHLGLLRSAVATLFPVIEGIIRRVANARGEDVGMGTRGLVAEIDALIERERADGFPANDERITMLEVFRDFLGGTLLANTRDFDGARDLNRHGVLHGVFLNFDHSVNFYVLISILDLLTFVLTYHATGVSVLAPDHTRESWELGEHYRALQSVAAMRRAIGAGS